MRIRVLDETEAVLAESHPLVVREGPFGGYWGDMHGQSGESIGITTARQYFDFARNKSFLDATGHQANDFQVNNAFWAYLQTLTAQYNEDGVFVTLPGYEWSGNTAVGGDRNVYYRTEGRPIFRSSHALLPDRSDLHTDASNANLLFERLAGEDCMAYAHVGGRYADTAYAHDGRIETAMEIHSAWGTFEWLLTDGFALGHRCGVVCNSDGHKGRPGASYPGAATFGAYGGLTCFYAEELTRDGLFECLRKRHHFGTTGTRMHLDVRASFEGGGDLFDRDPNVFDDATATRVDEVMMGDIVRTGDERVTLRIEVVAQAPIERIEVRNGLDVVRTLRPFDRSGLGDRIRVLWSGAEYRGARPHHPLEGPGAIPWRPHSRDAKDQHLEPRAHRRASLGRHGAIRHHHHRKFRRLRCVARSERDRESRPRVQPRNAGDVARRHRNGRCGHGGGWTRTQDPGVPTAGRERVPRDERGGGARSQPERRQPALGLGVHRRRVSGLEQSDLHVPGDLRGRRPHSGRSASDNMAPVRADCRSTEPILQVFEIPYSDPVCLAFSSRFFPRRDSIAS